MVLLEYEMLSRSKRPYQQLTFQPKQRHARMIPPESTNPRTHAAHRLNPRSPTHPTRSAHAARNCISIPTHQARRIKSAMIGLSPLGPARQSRDLDCPATCFSAARIVPMCSGGSSVSPKVNCTRTSRGGFQASAQTRPGHEGHAQQSESSTIRAEQPWNEYDITKLPPRSGLQEL